MRLDDFSGRGEAPMSPEVSVSTRHFANHFEIPLLFHAACLAHLALGVASVFAVALAWGFVVCAPCTCASTSAATASCGASTSIYSPRR
jgi:hypothetical protein